MSRTTSLLPFRAWSRLLRALSVAVPSVALVVALSPLPAPADTVTTPIDSWGTAATSNGRAQDVLATVVGDDGTAYLGGAFTTMVGPGGVGSATRAHLAAVSSTGQLTAWNPHADKTVWALALSADHQSVYVAGDFKHIQGRSVFKLAKVSLADGTVDQSFHPAVNGRVRTLFLDGTTLYIGGEFTSVGGQPRPKVAAIDAATGALSPWTPPALGAGRYVGHTGIPTPSAPSGNVDAVAVIGTQVFVAGEFIDFGGQGGLVSFDATTGAVTGYQYHPGIPMFSLATSGGILYAAGGGPGGRAIAYDPTKPKPLWTAKFDGDAVGVATDGTTVYVAGHYDYIVAKNSSCYQSCPGGPTRHHLAAFNAADGMLTPWNPTADTITGPKGFGIGTDRVFVVGEFTRINGASHPGIAIFPNTP
jgi:hypothetical protein